MTTPSKDTLLALLREMGLFELAKNLGTIPFQSICSYPVSDWIEFGTNYLQAKAIHNHLRQPASIDTMNVDQNLPNPSRFINTATVVMTSGGLSEWLSGSPTNSSSELTDSELISQYEINAKYPIQFPLAGRDESLAHIATCFSTVYQNRCTDDRNQRPIPICTGVPGLGKTRLMKECASTVLDMTRIPGKRLSAIISFGNDGNAYGWVDESLGIECSFAWRVLHSVFKAQYSYEGWMCDKSPSNRKELTLRLVLRTIEEHWSKKTINGNILVFVGVDEYQKLDQGNLERLLNALCDCSRVPVNSRLTLFSMLAGTDLNKTRIARTSFPNTERVPIRFLNHSESMKAIGPYLSKVHPGFIVSESFAHNVYYLGGVPRLLTKFAEKVSKMKLVDLFENNLRDARSAVLSNLQFPQLSVSDLLKLLAISFTNTSVNNTLYCPFKESTMESAKYLNWSQMVSIGICLIQDDGRVIVPFHLVSQVVDRHLSEGATLDETEEALISSLKDLSDNVGIPFHNVPAWLSWESFGAHFYCVRINSFLVLGRSVLPLSDLLRGSRFREDDHVFKTQVQIRVAKVFHSNEQYGPDMPRLITQNKASYISVDWVDGSCLQVVLNGDDGAGVDIFFALKRPDNSGYILILDQRKRLGSDITSSVISNFMAKIPEKPGFFSSQTVESIVGLMSIYSSISVDPFPDSSFFVSNSDSLRFHGSFFDHPGCSVAIDVNSSLSTSIQQLFRGTQQKRKELAGGIIAYRKVARIENFEQLLSVVSRLGGELDDSAVSRIKF